ncbi:hypothetical protein [Streptomyces drozdowiczii]|uniref:Uncharacterized protein n=1 Tax=Streptomyces drozdowiczii TaxID=202862 RepID=A0ABY6PKF3_9ACTN|nr:hypothetical protein [Streptomyces drozdowiczii]MCX0241910.1 hypothetical protein [Streptomyces drozdowiczii]MCX0247902.1 hypothetical protein [Streptomyces drozdowiczii]UZK52738.1 hypothetical protein NEH16_00165 [Streptomyces drozdowiczii]UZK57978.1 hypothetical protein NEH16_31300 [Streptomyces drozdowiczii]
MPLSLPRAPVPLRAKGQARPPVVLLEVRMDGLGGAVGEEAEEVPGAVRFRAARGNSMSEPVRQALPPVSHHRQAVTRGAPRPSSTKAGSSRSGRSAAGTSSMSPGRTCSSSVPHGLISDSWSKPRTSTRAGVKKTEKPAPEPLSVRAASVAGPQVVEKE